MKASAHAAPHAGSPLPHMIDSGLVGSTDWERYHNSRRCSRGTYPESYITKYTSVRRYRAAVDCLDPFKIIFVY